MQSYANDYWTATAMAATAAIASEAKKDPITIYGENGSMYHGYVNEHGAKHGQGTLKTDIYITGMAGDETSHGMRWTEFSGNWDNGMMHGYGVMRIMSERGVVSVMYNGMWDNGVPAHMSSGNVGDHSDDSDDDEDSVVYDDAYYDRIYESDLPQRGDYDHSEEAS